MELIERVARSFCDGAYVQKAFLILKEFISVYPWALCLFNGIKTQEKMRQEGKSVISAIGNRLQL